MAYIEITQGTGTKVRTDTVGSSEHVQYMKIMDGTAASTNILLVNSDGSLNGKIQGNVAGGAADSGNPIKIGAVFNSAFPVYTSGQRTEIQTDSNGVPYVRATGIFNSVLPTYTTGQRTEFQTDSNGVQLVKVVNSFANVQYAEGGTASTITGTAMMWEDTSDTLRPVSAAKPLPVNMVSGTVSLTNLVGGNNIYSNTLNDFVATANSGAKTITFSSFAGSSFSSTYTARNFANAIIKRINSAGVVDTLPLTNVALSGNVLTLADMAANFSSGDLVAVFVPGPDKGYDEGNDLIKVGLAQAIQGLLTGAELDHIGVHPKKRADAFQDLSFDGTHSTSATTAKAATSGKKHYITNLSISTSAAATVTVDDGSGTVLEKLILPAAGVWQFTYDDCPLEGGTNSVIRVTSSVSSGSLVVKGRGYTI